MKYYPHSCENVNIHSMETLECKGSLQRYMLKHAAAVCCNTNCSVHYSTTLLHHVPTDLRLSATVIKPGQKGKDQLTLPPL